MDCDKCGAVVPEGAETCPECGVPVTDDSVPSTDDSVPSTDTPVPSTDDSVPSTDDSVPSTDDSVPSTDTTGAEVTPAGGKRTMLIVAVAAVLVILIGVGTWFVVKGGVIGGGDPKTVATKMLTAYAAYDAKGILAVSTHGSLDATGTKSFEDAAAQAKTRANGKAGVKDFTVDKVDQSGDQTATVTITGQWLTDPATGAYAKRTEKLGLVKQNGAWLVQLF